MKITKPPKSKNPYYIAKEKANKGCDKCPCCGENEIYKILPGREIKRKGIRHSLMTCYSHTLFFKSKEYMIDYYECMTCGAEYQSERYLAEREYKYES